MTREKVNAALARVRQAHVDDANYPLDAPSGDGQHTWFQLLQKLDQTKDLTLLLPLLNVPDFVRPHLEELLRGRHGRAVPSYLPMSEKSAAIELMADFVRAFKDEGGSDKEVEFITAKLANGIDRRQLNDALTGKRSALRSQAQRRAARKGAN
jgi:hypothetical protein